MKMIRWFILLIFFLITNVSSTNAFDIDTLDRVSVLFPKSRVHNIIGKPTDTGYLGKGLRLEFYRTDNIPAMAGTGAIYDEGGVLKGQTFIFSGAVAKLAANRIKELGFQLIESKANSYRLSGKDDDTGQPIIVYVLQEGGLTTVFIFEKQFYEEQVR